MHAISGFELSVERIYAVLMFLQSSLGYRRHCDDLGLLQTDRFGIRRGEEERGGEVEAGNLEFSHWW